MKQGLKLTSELGFLRAGVAVPELRVCDVDFNVSAIGSMIEQAAGEGVQALAFPEMAVTGYTIGDLLMQQALPEKAEDGLKALIKTSAGHAMLVMAGMPLVFEGKVYNCAVAFCSGKLLAVVPKVFLPSYNEFYEQRWFASGATSREGIISLAGQQAPFGTNTLLSLSCGGAHAPVLVGIEVCEDLWVPVSPHAHQALAGAVVLFNLSASNELIGKSDWRRNMVSSESGRCISAYCYVSSGTGESSNDVVFGGHCMIAENGAIIGETDRLFSGSRLLVRDIDLDRLEHDRRSNSSFRDISILPQPFIIVEGIEVQDPAPGTVQRTLDARPFVPGDAARRAERCHDIFSMQVAALAKKLSGSHLDKIVIGVSGGLDSTHALLVAAKTMDYLKLPRANVFAYTLPGFGTTSRTRLNARRLAAALSVNLSQVNIGRTCNSQLKDLEHDGAQDVVFENVQARYRTAYLFNKANQIGGLVLGTSDLTEIALGWSTFAGDHMSHYHVNASVPKTLIRYLVKWVAEEEYAETAGKVLHDILATPISPELRRPVDGKIAQHSEDVIGPVELADFFLYPFIRFGMRPGKVLFLAEEVRRQGLFEGQYTLEDLHKWLASFLRRFFGNQFKRTCLPEGPKIGTVSLSPRGDWRMPSDSEPRLWESDLEEMYMRLTASR